MTLTFHAETGALTTDLDTFERLVAGDAAGGETVDGIDDERVRAGLEAAAHPICTLRLTQLKGSESRIHGIWIASGAAAVLLENNDGTRQFLTLSPEFVPSLIVRTVGLGPCLTGERQPLTNPVDLDDLFNPDDDRRGTAFQTAVKGVGSTDEAAVWRAEMTWTGPEGPDGRVIVILDTATGMWSLTRSDGGTEFTPATPTEIFLALIGLFPRPDELAEPPAPATPATEDGA